MEDIQYNKRMPFCILGAGGLGRELESWISGDEIFKYNYKLLGYLDKNLNAFQNITTKYSVLGDIDKDSISNCPNVLLGIAGMPVKLRVLTLLQNYNVNILSYMHKSVIIGNNTLYQKGIVSCPNTIISCNVKIGNFFFLNIGSQVGHDCIIGNNVSIMANVDLGGGAHIGNNVFIGSNATILPGVKIPDNTTIGAGSVVIRSIKQAGTYFGNPAKRII